MIDKKVLDLKERRFYIRLIVTILILYMVGTLFYKSISPFHNCIRDNKANVIECTRIVLGNIKFQNILHALFL